MPPAQRRDSSNTGLTLFAQGNALARQYRFEEAASAYRQALAAAPHLSGAWNNLGNVEKYLGHFDAAMDCYQRALEVMASNGEATPEELARRHSNLLISSHYLDSLSHDRLFELHREWAARHADRLAPDSVAWPHSLEEDRPLRLGYVSGSFNGKIVGHLLYSILRTHDRRRFTLAAYSSTRESDAYTTCLREQFHLWRDVSGQDDATVCRQIREDRIDILVDLDGHSPTGRPLIFARRAAPVQVAWLDYFNTTGLSTMDYILTDPHTTPEDSPQRYTETVWRLPETRFCYTPPDYAPPVAPAPTLESGRLTFGSFNRQDKLNPRLIDLWAKLLRTTPDTRLLLKNTALDITAVRQTLMERFTRQGVEPERLILRGRSPHAQMLAEYGEVDIALDTFPYNGGLTSCECLWMGVPIVALEGERMIARQTAAMLRLLGLDDWVARTPEEYLDIARHKSRQILEVTDLRARLRKLMIASTLCDAERFTRQLESAYRDMWRRFRGMASTSRTEQCDP